MRRIVAVGALALVASGIVPMGARLSAPPHAGIRALLERRAEAMLEGDEAAFMATVTSDDQSFLRRQHRLFDGFQQLGLADYRLLPTERYWPELTTGREVRRYGKAADPTVLHVEERYRVRGFDQQAAVDDLYLTFIRADDGWRIASDSDLADVRLLSGRKLWELGPVETRRSEHFLYVSHPDLASAGAAILEASERALQAVSRRWPLPWSQRVVLLAPSSTEELERIIQATFDLEPFAAFAYSSVDRAKDYDLTGHRVIFVWENFGLYSEDIQQAILTHELLHVATREYSGPMVPVFMEEGLAEWVAAAAGTAELAARVDAGTFDRRLPRDHEFFTGSDLEIGLSYQESLTAAQYAIERYGVDAAARMYRQLGAVRLAPGTSEYHVDQAMRSAFGVGLQRFESRWARWVMERVG